MNNNVDLVDDTCKVIIRNISKALLLKLPDLYKERRLNGTNNSVRYLPQDSINDSLCEVLSSIGGVYVRVFKVAFNWEILIVIDMIHKKTYTIHNVTALKREYPDYLKSIVKAEGCKQVKVAKQTSLFDEDDCFVQNPMQADDFANEIKKHCSGYRHYAIAYEFKNSEVISMKMLLLGINSDKLIVESEQSVLNYILPIYHSNYLESSSNTSSEKRLDVATEGIDEQSSSQLFKLKKNIMKRSL